jgi:hypothetical protein
MIGNAVPVVNTTDLAAPAFMIEAVELLPGAP